MKTTNTMQEEKLSKPNWRDKHSTPRKEPQSLFFSIVKQQGKTAELLNFQFKNGKQKAFPYASISEMEFDPAKGSIVLLLGYASIFIRGKHLEELYKKLVVMKVLEIREFTNTTFFTPDDNQTFITQIECESALGNEEREVR